MIEIDDQFSVAEVVTEKNKTLELKDFDLTIPYKLGTILYSCNSDITNLTIKTWMVTGHKLDNNSNKRNFNCLLMSYPISVYIKEVEHSSIKDLHKVFTDKKEALEYNKAKAYEWYVDIVEKIDEQK